MKICINAIVGRNAPPENALKFLETLKKTSGDFSVCVVNSSKKRMRFLEGDGAFSNIHVIENCIDPGFATMANQGLHYSISEGFDYSISVNAPYTLVVDPNWLQKTMEQFNSKKGMGGTVYPVRIGNSESVRKVLYGISSKGNIEWLSKWINRYMVGKFVDGNVFIVDNQTLSELSLPNTKYCDERSYGLYLSFLLLKNGIEPTPIGSIYSSNVDTYRYDVFTVVKKGAGIIHPVTIDSVRNRFE